jgi:hypothetical protein
LNVNGVSLLGLSNSAAMDTLRRAIVHTEGPKFGAITLTVARKIGNNHSHNSSEGSSSSVHQKQRRNSSSSLLTDSSGLYFRILNISFSWNAYRGRLDHEQISLFLQRAPQRRLVALIRIIRRLQAPIILATASSPTTPWSFCRPRRYHRNRLQK